jgi:hypothetical protein
MFTVFSQEENANSTKIIPKEFRHLLAFWKGFFNMLSAKINEKNDDYKVGYFEFTETSFFLPLIMYKFAVQS